MVQFIFVFLGISLSLLVVLQLSGFIVSQWRDITDNRLRSQVNREDLAARAAALKRETLKEATSRPAWQGWRKLTVVETVEESNDCRSLYMKAADDTPLPPFRPGQFITVGRPDDAVGGKMATRCYSLSDAPDPRYWRITVKRIEGGLMSPKLHHSVHLGDTLLVRAPMGKFVPTLTDNRPLTLVAAGVGITPMVSMTRYCLTWQPERTVRLFYQVRDGQHAPLLNPLRRWAAESEHFHLTVSYSRPGPDDKADLTGRLSVAVLFRQGASYDGEFFICGSNPFMQSMRTELIGAGIPSDAVHIESFGGPNGQPAEPKEEASSSQKAPTSDVAAANHAISFSKSGCTAEWSEADESLLDVAERAGASIDSGCREGQCGACMVRLLSGTVAYRTEPGAPLQEGETLACVAQPTSPINVDA